MEQAGGQHWTLMKGKQRNIMMNTINMNPYSWVNMERAFAEDAGGCMWPPRSYTCGFCRREFMSAQALGGHMNVHRRDRAMLSQSLSPNFSANIVSASPPSRVSKVEDSTRRGRDRFDIGTDLSVGLNCSASTDMGCKRPRLAVSPSPLKPICFEAVEMVGFRASSMEDLDLELRLGHDPPQVK